MADNFSDKVVKKLQKQNLAVDLTEEVIKTAAIEEVTAQSQDFQTLAANSGTPGASANGKDIVVIPGSGTAANDTSQINFYWSKPTTQGSNNVDINYRTTIFNYVENGSPNEEPVLAIGGYNGSYYSPSATYGGGTAQNVAKIWFHPFTGTIDTSILALDQVANTASIKFGIGTVTQTTSTKGHLGWTGSRLVIGDGSTANSIAYTSDLAGAQNIFQNMTDGTNIAVADTSSDTFTFTAGTGITCLVNVAADSLTISTSNIPNASLANSSVTIGSTSIALGASTLTLAGLTSVAATTFTGALTGNASTATNLLTARNIQGQSFNGSADITVVTAGTGVTVTGTSVAIGQAVATSSNVQFGSVLSNNIRIGSTANQIDTSSGNLVLDSTGGQVTINDNVVINGTSVTLAAASATISANSNKIQNVTDPTAPQDAATKAYVDAFSSGLDLHESVRATTGTTQIATAVLYFQGADAIGSYIESSAAESLSATYFDGQTLNSGNRVLVAAGAQSVTYSINGSAATPPGGTNVINGIYTVTSVGGGGGKWRLTRALDTDNNLELEGGTFCFVETGGTYADTAWVCTNDTHTTLIAIGIDAIGFTQFSGAGQIEAGNGLTKSTNTINAVGTINRISVGADNIDIDANYVGQSSITTLGTIGTGTWNATVISTAKGGTGLSSLTSGGLLYASSSSVISFAQGTSGQILVANASNIPAFVSLSGDAGIVASGAFTLNTVNSNTGSFGTSTAIPSINVNGKGLITAVSTNTIPDATISSKGIASFNTTNFSVTAGAVSLSTVPIASGGLNRTTGISGLVFGDGSSYAAATAANINSTYGVQNVNVVLAGPTSGGAANPSFRSLVVADLPTVTISKGGTNATSQTNGGITYFDNTSIVSGTALTWVPGNSTGTGTTSSHYINAASLTSGTAVTINVPTGATGKIIVGQLNSVDKFSVDANGNLRATTKSFDIPHPTKEGKRLVYGVLEGPEHGVYHRGTVEGKDKIKIELPEYWHKLVGEDYSVQLTSWGAYAVHLVEKTENYFIIQLSSNFVMRKLKTIKVDYVVHGARLDAPLEIEQ